MKKSILQSILPAALLLVIASSCNSSSKDDMKKDLQKDVQKTLKTDPPKDAQGSSVSADGPKETMGVVAAKTFIAAAKDNPGKTVTVNGYPSGMTKAVNGEFMLYLSDESGSGLPKENFACNFKEEMKDAVKAQKAGELVKVVGNIAYNNGMVILKNAKLAE